VARLKDGLHTLLDLLAGLPIDDYARQTGFVHRLAKKIQPLLFVQAGILLVSQGRVSLQRWAALLGTLSNLVISKQALWERLTLGMVRFMRRVLAQVMGRVAHLPTNAPWLASLGFKRILLEDSTLVRLGASLAKTFPGSSNQCGTKDGQLRIQCIYDLMSQSFVRFALSSFRLNDRAVARHIVKIVRAGDLIIRDLGYFVLQAFQEFELLKAFFVSRLRSDTLIYQADGLKEVDLLELLKRYGQVDQWVSLGQIKAPARLVGIKLEESVANERRRRARHNRDRRSPPGARELALLGWAILVTNIPAKQLSPQAIARLYGLRWRIEIVFKTWKSHFKLLAVPKGSVHELEAVIYARLIFLTGFMQACALGWLRPEAAQESSRSLLKLAALVADFFMVLFFEALGRCVTEAVLLQMLYHTRYDRRRRNNFSRGLNTLS
jgi:hypothetical protein